MSLISKRPTHWNEVVGQQPVQLTLAGAIANTSFLPRGYIFSGDTGVGKTTVAYLFARLAMCVARDPFNCPGCPSCDTFSIDHNGKLSDHPNFTEVDAASTSSVKNAREILEMVAEPPQGAMRRVVLIDEAHRLSKEAWDVYLKPLEEDNTDVLFIFSTNELLSIPKTIMSRCILQEFALVPREDILGMLMAISDRERFTYTLDGLRHIAELAKGRPRVAINFLQTVATTGPITPESCGKVLREDLIGTATKILELLVMASKVPDRAEECLAELIRLAENTAQISTPRRLLDALFTFFARAFFQETVVAYAFTNHEAVTSIFLKWTKTQQIPVDALPLVFMELLDLLPGRTQAIATPAQRQSVFDRVNHTVQPAATAEPDPEPELSPDELDMLIGENA